MKVKGHIKDTAKVHALEKQREVRLAGCSASWVDPIFNLQTGRDEYRVYAYSTILDQWHGVFLLTEEDIEQYPE